MSAVVYRLPTKRASKPVTLAEVQQNARDALREYWGREAAWIHHGLDQRRKLLAHAVAGLTVALAMAEHDVEVARLML